MLSADRRDLLLDPETNDLVITTDLQWSSGVSGVAQSCRILIQMFQGEWFLSQDTGIPYWQDILRQKPAIGIAAARSYLRSALLSVEDVSDVTTLTLSFNSGTRALSITWAVSTSFGDTSINTSTVVIGSGGSLNSGAV